MRLLRDRKANIEASALPGRAKEARTSASQIANTPAVALDPGVKLFAELFGDPSAAASRWFVGCALSMLLNIILVIAILSLFPLKETIPYMVESNSAGVVGRVVKAEHYTPTEAMIKSELARWTDRIMTIDPHRTRDNLRLSTKPLRGKAVAQHSILLEKDAVFKRMLENPQLVRTVDVSGIDTSQKGIAFIFVTTTERRGTEEALLQKWRFTVHYTLSVPSNEREIIDNPSGLNITHFERGQDNS